MESALTFPYNVPMNNYVQLTSGGILRNIVNISRQQDHFIRHRDGLVQVLDKASRRVKHQFSTEEEAEMFFRDTVPADNNVWNDLRESCVVASITASQVVKVVESLEPLKILVSTLNPNWNKYQTEVDGSTMINIARSIHFGDGQVKRPVVYSGRINPQGSAILSFKTKTGIYIKDHTPLWTGTSWTLMEVLWTIFGTKTDPVTIKKDGIYSGDKKVDAFKHLMSECTIDPGVTLQDIFNIVSNDTMLTMFLTRYSWCDGLSEIHGVKATKSTLKYLELSNRGNFKDNMLDISMNFHAIGPVSKQSKEIWDKPPRNETFTVSSVPIEELASLPVRLNPVMVLSGMNWVDGENRTTNTLLDILDTIYWEISFYGGPKRKSADDKEIDKLKKEFDSDEDRYYQYIEDEDPFHDEEYR